MHFDHATCAINSTKKCVLLKLEIPTIFDLDDSSIYYILWYYIKEKEME